MLAILEADKRVSGVERVPVHVRESSRGHLLSGDEADVPGRQRAGAQVLCLRAAREPGGEGAPATAEEVTVRGGGRQSLARGYLFGGGGQGVNEEFYNL